MRRRYAPAKAAATARRSRQWAAAIVVLALLVCSRSGSRRPSSPTDPYERLYASRLLPPIPAYAERHFASACVLARDASDLLPEFLVRNYMAGIDHFYVYGDDHEADELQRMARVVHTFHRIVTYMPAGRLLPDDPENGTNYVQMRIYRHCAETFGPRTRWMAFIDADELFETDVLEELLPNVPHEQLGNTAFLRAALNAHNDHPVLCVRWRSALTNGHIVPPSTSLMDSFSSPCALLVNNTIKLSLRKTILRPGLLDFNLTPKLDTAIHKGFRLRPPWQRYHCIWGPGANITPPFYLAHYWSRSLADYVIKVQRGRPRAGVPSRTIIDLIKREAACQPDLTPRVHPARRAALAQLSELLNVVPRRTLSAGAVERFLVALPRTNDSELCVGRIHTLLRRVAQGYTLSQEKYCASMPNSPACVRASSQEASARYWPLLWTEYVQTCQDELPDVFDKV